jgi:hypothetical protein
LTSLGYDAGALAYGTGGEPFSQQAIVNPRGLTGVDGVFRFAPGGPVQRGLAVLEGEPQGDVVISPAPQTFQGSRLPKPSDRIVSLPCSTGRSA